MSSKRKMMRKKHLDVKCDLKTFDFTEDEKEKLYETKKVLSGSDEDGREDGPALVDKQSKKRLAAFEVEDQTCAVGGDVQSMLEKFGANISKAMQAKRSRLECLTNSYIKGSEHKIEQLWKNHYSQRKKLTEQYTQQVSSVLQQWETDAHRVEEQEEKLNNHIRQMQKLIQQLRVMQNQKLKSVRELYEQYVKHMEEMEKSHEAFMEGTQQELRKEMDTLQKKILMDTQQQEMATVRKSLQSMLF